MMKTIPLPKVNEILKLYYENRYIDAYNRYSWIWGNLEQNVNTFSCEMCVHLGRLSGRLGSRKAQNILFNRAMELDQEHPLSRFYVQRYVDDFNIISDIVNFEKNPDLIFSDLEFQSNWYASNACLYAFVRDFDEAHRLLEKARKLESNIAWVAACTADVLFREDRWDEALVEAEIAFKLSPHMPAAVSILGQILVKKDQAERMISFIEPWLDTCQSYQFMMTAIWYYCVNAERSDEPRRTDLTHKANELSSRLEKLAPIADENTLATFKACRMDISMISCDYEAMARDGKHTNSPFYDQVIQNTKTNKKDNRLVTPFRAVFQKHLTCLPSSAASVLGAFDIHVDEDELSRELTYNGTAIWRIEDWFQSRDIETLSLVLEPDLMVSMIKNGLPFIVSNQYTNFSHATAVVGIDERMGTFLVHDPSYERIVHVLIDRFDETEKPFGPLGLALVPKDKSHLLNSIPDHAHEPARVYYAYCRSMDLHMPNQAIRQLRAFVDSHPNEPFSQRFEALEKAERGFLFQAIEIQKKLLNTYPNCLIILKELLGNLHRTRNKSFIRSVLKKIVTRGKIPGISKQKEWDYPPTTYVAQYADYLGDNAERYKEAEELLMSALKRDPWSAETYHILGDIYYRQAKHNDALIPFRLAALMDAHNEHYARAACDAFRQTGREKDGLDFLFRRMEKLEDQIHGSQAAITLVEAFLDYGYPDRAVEIMTQALERWENDPQLSSYVVEFWVRMGIWDRAEAALSKIAQTEHRILYLTAAVKYYRQAGQWEKALEEASAWMEEQPSDINARRHVLFGYKRKEGQRKALALAKRWMEEFKDDEAFEELYYDELKALNETHEQEVTIRKRIKRNPYDIWAWHELGFLILGRADLVSGEERDAMLKKIEAVQNRLDIIAPDHPVTHALKGDILSSRQDFKKAASHYLQAIDDDPDYSYCYSRVWEVSQSFPEIRQKSLVSALEGKIFRTVGFLHEARSLVFKIADRFGARIAEEIIERWGQQKPDDPELIKARVDLLLNYGQGRSDANKAADIIEAALLRFPNHFGLLQSLAQTYNILLKQDKETKVLQEIIRRYPLNSDSRNKLSRILYESGQAEEALNLLREGLSFDPMDGAVWQELSNLLWAMDRYEEALATLERGLTLMPEHIPIRRAYSQRLKEAGHDDKSIAVLEDGIEVYPEGAYLWYLYGHALMFSNSHTDTQDMEHALRKALTLNHTLFEAADDLAILLTEQSRFTEARELMEHQIKILDDPMAAHGRMVWIKRQAGKTSEALEEMVGIVRKWPTYDWAWSQLVHWLETDEAYKLARDILDKVHPVMADNPGFMADRLILLKKSGVSNDDLLLQWDTLLSNFPRYERLHTLRIDQLIQDEEYDAAERILEGIERFHSESPYTRLRRVYLSVEINRFDEAVECACKIWTKFGTDDSWPDERAWNVIKEAGYMENALKAMLSLIDSGQRLRPRAFFNLVENLRTLETRRLFLYTAIPFKWIFKARTTERLVRLLEMVRLQEWDKGTYQAMVLDAMIDFGEQRIVRQYARLHWEECLQNTAIWQNLGRIHISDKRRDYLFVRKLMAGWRDRPGCQMWAVTNYVLCLRRSQSWLPLSEDLDELYRTTRDLITTVPHDHTIQYVVMVCCEAALRKGLDDEFLAMTDQFDHILKDKKSGYWVQNSTQWILDILPLFRRLIIEADIQARMELSRQLISILKVNPVNNAYNWIRKEWMKRLLPGMNWYERIRAKILFM